VRIAWREAAGGFATAALWNVDVRSSHHKATFRRPNQVRFSLEADITVATARVLQESMQIFRLAEIHLNAGRSEVCRVMPAKC
jgi:hypothetical protein